MTLFLDGTLLRHWLHDWLFVMHRKVFRLLVIVCCRSWKPGLIVTATILGFWCLYILILVNNIIGWYPIKFIQSLLCYIGEQRWDLVIRSSGCMIRLNTTKKVTNDNIPESRGEWSRAQRMLLQCINGVGSNPVEGRTKNWQL